MSGAVLSPYFYFGGIFSKCGTRFSSKFVNSFFIFVIVSSAAAATAALIPQDNKAGLSWIKQFLGFFWFFRKKCWIRCGAIGKYKNVYLFSSDNVLSKKFNTSIRYRGIKLNYFNLKTEIGHFYYTYCFFKNWAIPGLIFFIFVFSIKFFNKVDSK